MKILLLVALVGLFVVVNSSGQTTIPWSVVGSGGTIGAVGNNRLLSATIGQVAIGIGVITDGSAISQGFWLPINQTTSVDEERADDATGIATNFPNPFSTTTTIRLTAPAEGHVTVRIFDLVGNLVRSIDADLSTAGNQDISFDGLSDNGAPLAAGAYLYEVAVTSATTGERMQAIQRMSIVR